MKPKILKFVQTTDGELLPLPMQMLMQTIFLGGNKGSGKTSSMKRLFEAAHAAGAQCGVVAPLGRWWSLRIAKNGKGRGLKDVFVFGGKHGDVPIDATSGRAVARAVSQKRIHFVLDVELMRKKDRIPFVADFLEELWQLKKEEDASHPMVVFIDEAQTVAPQKTSGAEAERMKEAAADLCREGRNHGVGMVLSAQRSANVDKDLLALCEMLIVMRTVHHLDREVYRKWVDEKGDKDEDENAWLKKLRRLEKGQAYVYAPEVGIFERVQVLMPDTFDATATATIGEKVAKVGRMSKLDVKKLGEELVTAATEAAANDPRKLREENERLKQLVRQHELGHFIDKHKVAIHQTHQELYLKWEKVHLEPVKAQLVKIRALKVKELVKVVDDIEEGVDRFCSAGKELSVVRSQLDKNLGAWETAIAAVWTHLEHGEKKGLGQLANVPPHQLFLKSPLPGPYFAKQTLSDGSLPPGRYVARIKDVTLTKTGTLKQRVEVAEGAHAGKTITTAQNAFKLVGRMQDMLDALHQGGLSRDDLIAVVGMAPGGGSNNYVSALKNEGLITLDGPHYVLTAKGASMVKVPDYLLDVDSVVARHNNIVGKMRDMVVFVRQVASASRDQIVAAAGMAPGGGSNNYVAALKSRGIFVQPSKGAPYSINPVFR